MNNLVGKNAFMFVLHGVKFFVQTDKKIRNKKDASKLLELIVNINDIKVSKFDQKAIDKTIDMIQAQMALVNITGVKNNQVMFAEKYGGGCFDIITDGYVSQTRYVVAK